MAVAKQRPVPPGAMITDPMTWPEIVAAYPDQWVCVAEIEWARPGDYNPLRARVIGYGTRRGSFVMADPWNDIYLSQGHFFTGKVRPLHAWER